LFERAREVMPGGVSSPVRAFRSVGGTPVYMREGIGGRCVDEDGNEYVDFCLSWGPLILGHAHPAVVAAVQATAAHGLTFGTCHRLEVELAELVLSAFPGMEMVRFTGSGTEAVMTAIRLARGATGRDRILKFDGGYHGHSDALLVKAGSGLVTFGTSSSLGVPDAVARDTVVVPFDDDEALAAAFSAHGAELAAAIVEPLPANNGLLVQRPEWLRRLRELCTAHGALLIADEVISGFRCRFGGYADSLDVAADLVTLGKIIGGGMPVGAVVGPRRLMELLAPVGGVYQAGTLSGNPVALAAGIATLRELAGSGAYAALEALGVELDAAVAAVAATVPTCHWLRVGSLFWIYLGDGAPPRRADRIEPVAARRYAAVHAALLDRGVYLAPSAYEVGFLCTAHRDDDMRALAAVLADALATVGGPA
jgi:glutamate-1-semialdehyde 2,1-aminomutase